MCVCVNVCVLCECVRMSLPSFLTHPHAPTHPHTQRANQYSEAARDAAWAGSDLSLPASGAVSETSETVVTFPSASDSERNSFDPYGYHTTPSRGQLIRVYNQTLAASSSSPSSQIYLGVWSKRPFAVRTIKGRSINYNVRRLNGPTGEPVNAYASAVQKPQDVARADSKKRRFSDPVLLFWCQDFSGAVDKFRYSSALRK